MKEVMKVAKEMMKGSGVSKIGVEYLSKRIKVVMTRNQNVKEMLVNHRKVIEGFGEEKPECVCGGEEETCGQERKQVGMWERSGIPSPLQICTTTKQGRHKGNSETKYRKVVELD